MHIILSRPKAFILSHVLLFHICISVLGFVQHHELFCYYVWIVFLISTTLLHVYWSGFHFIKVSSAIHECFHSSFCQVLLLCKYSKLLLILNCLRALRTNLYRSLVYKIYFARSNHYQIYKLTLVQSLKVV